MRRYFFRESRIVSSHKNILSFMRRTVKHALRILFACEIKTPGVQYRLFLILSEVLFSLRSKSYWISFSSQLKNGSAQSADPSVLVSVRCGLLDFPIDSVEFHRFPFDPLDIQFSRPEHRKLVDFSEVRWRWNPKVRQQIEISRFLTYVFRGNG